MIELNLKGMEFGYQLVLLISTLLKMCGIFYIVIFEKEDQLVPFKKGGAGHCIYSATEVVDNRWRI
jgi:hypothetical protein